ncbi:MAG TPA: choice-of-anchor D domain-containing protein, partial [Candidatus Polarisedimenticolia bacterium]|nr:choice-of-anchor D domain-containing protein [Candidatus Polarisedimenticolia bacterium]
MTGLRRLLRARVAVPALVMLATLLPSTALALTGDANGDGRFDLKDPLALCRYLSGAAATLPNPADADVNYDGALDRADVDLMLQGVLGAPLPTTLLTAAPPALGFGEVTVGEAANLQVMIGNAGDTTVTLQSIALGAGTSGAFSVVAAPPTPSPLAVGGHVTLTVRYAPAGSGLDTGSLTVLSTGADVTVPLSGTGVRAELSVTPLAIDFGGVVAGQEATRPATIRNSGTAPLEVTSVAPGPGTSPDFALVSVPATPFTLAPGQETGLTVRYAPHGGGDDSGSIEILSAVGSASISLTGRGLIAVLAVEPAQLDFGNVLAGASRTLPFEIRNTGTAPLGVTGLALGLGTSGDFALVSPPGTPFTIDPGMARSVAVIYAPLAGGPDSGQVEVHTGAGDATVSLSGAGVAPEIDLTPGSVTFGNVMVGDTLTRPVGIANSGTADLTVSAIALATGGSPDITLRDLPHLPLVLAPGSGVVVTLAYTPGEVGPDTASLEIGSDALGIPAVQVPISGNGVMAELALQPNALVFSNVRVGQTLQLDFAIRNSGTADLTVGGVALSAATSPELTLVAPPALPFTLAPGQERLVTVRYAPVDAGGDAGTVLIETSAGPGQVDLSGSGIAPEIDVTPAQLDFGGVPIGETSAPLEVTIRNLGSDTLAVSSITLTDGAPFHFVEPPAVPAAVAPGGSLVVALVYRPTIARHDSASLS